jgi:hypothetical protein
MIAEMAPSRIRTRRARLFTAALIVTAIAVPLEPSAAAATPWATLLRPVPLTLADTADLWDLGITDIDGDGVPDLYSTNHNARQDVMLGDGELGFTDVVTALGLDQDTSLPGAEMTGPPPSTAAGGVYLWREGDDHVVIHATVTGAVPSVDLTMFTYGAFAHEEDSGVHVVTTTTTDTEGRPVDKIHVTATATGTATLNLELVGVPMHFSVASPADTSRISIGPGLLHPAATSFDWRLQDRHGIAWSDVDGDGDLDAFIVRGGLKGQLGTYTGLVSDELLLDEAGHFTDVTADTGIVKGECRGRRAVWVDYDGDGDLDLEVTCADGHPQLWRRDGPLAFTDVSALLPDGTDDTVFTWLDMNGDGRPELIAGREDGVGFYRADSQGTYVLRKLYASTAAPFSDVAITDRDENGVADVFFVSGSGAVLLTGRANGTFRADDPAAYGLPARARRIAFVDVDRDGRTDLFALPGGVYTQRPNHHYTATALLRDAAPWSAHTMGSLWFDGDGDGDPDAIVGYATDGAKQWNVTMYENRAAPSHWLALDLVGRTGNREAIGATVTVTAGGVTSHHWVDEAETARFSQGQYRIDVSLGRATTVADSVEITWPDGMTQTLTDVAADQHLEVTEPS